ncbi:hypothetical protein EAI_11139 [Harpegnathos saltator]|uniref:Uncharacterized protein n=1 Tax=Harpegnathos saltator TaxID=610380 RepID=E2BTL3_HARSA|nr:hypothetical protein EAI_11139 [Harpegnathos saltator]
MEDKRWVKESWKEKVKDEWKERYGREREKYYNRNGWGIAAIDSLGSEEENIKGKLVRREKEVQRQIEEGQIRGEV